MSGTLAARQWLLAGLLCLLAHTAWGQTPASLSILPNTVNPGAGCTGIVALSAPAKAAITLTLKSNNAGVTVPAQVTVAVGRQAATFAVSTQAGLKTAIVTVTASDGTNAAIGFLLVQSPPAAPLPAFAGFTFSPTLALSGQSIRGTLTFTQPLLVPLTFNLTSSNANFTVPSQVTVTAQSKSVSFPVTVGNGATTGIAQVTATLVPGVYVNSWTGPQSTSGSFAYLANTGLPPNYAAGFWFGALVKNNFVPTLKTYPDGRLCLGGVHYRTLFAPALSGGIRNPTGIGKPSSRQYSSQSIPI